LRESELRELKKALPETNTGCSKARCGHFAARRMILTGRFAKPGGFSLQKKNRSGSQDAWCLFINIYRHQGHQET
jgi:hypothetical protein